MNSTAAPEFWALYNQLTPELRKLADKNYRLWQGNPRHPSLRFLKVTPQMWSARVGRNYRAVAIFEAQRFVWVWIGKHTDYDAMLKQG
ncbi:MAG: hypothetical protein H8E27_13230 [Verrucomicrobia subdivision 3 bacterium]|nr:hypothetical protein [Limisphaerales bacterium]